MASVSNVQHVTAQAVPGNPMARVIAVMALPGKDSNNVVAPYQRVSIHSGRKQNITATNHHIFSPCQPTWVSCRQQTWSTVLPGMHGMPGGEGVIGPLTTVTCTPEHSPHFLHQSQCWCLKHNAQGTKHREPLTTHLRGLASICLNIQTLNDGITQTHSNISPGLSKPQE